MEARLQPGRSVARRLAQPEQRNNHLSVVRACLPQDLHVHSRTANNASTPRNIVPVRNTTLNSLPFA